MKFDIKDSVLGKNATNPDKYDATLLFRIPRSENRVHYNINDDKLPFVGFDVWNCYEVSFLLDNGLPVSRVLKLIYPADSKYLVESKSLKLYLNAFNMDNFGATVMIAENKVNEIIKTDVSKLLETDVKTVLFDKNSEVAQAYSSFNRIDLANLITVDQQEKIQFTKFIESPELLKCATTDATKEYAFTSDLLRSNCRVTNQPDWGDLFVQITTKQDIDLSSIMEYLVSFRKENHFHEEVVEMIYKRFWDKFMPEKLMVAAMYTRRGGIDINPIRASHAELIDSAMTSTTCRLDKTLRQ